MKRPRIFSGPASNYAGPGEVIREFGDGNGNGHGGLISIRHQEDGRLIFEVYNATGVDIRTPPKACDAERVLDRIAEAWNVARQGSEESGITDEVGFVEAVLTILRETGRLPS
jgi:hypothetical protein